jgi:hypothetical protein
VFADLARVARVRTSFTMLDMEMGTISPRFRRTAPAT